MAPLTVHWRPLYETAVLETDHSKLAAKIKVAELAIKLSLETLDRQTSEGEARALEKAMNALEGLRNKREG